MAIIEDEDKKKEVFVDQAPPIVKGIRTMFRPNTQQDYDRLSDNITSTLKENITPFVTYDPDKPGTTMAVPRLPLGTGTRDINVPSVNVDWGTRKSAEPPPLIEPAMGISHTVGSYPMIADKRRGTEAKRDTTKRVAMSTTGAKDWMTGFDVNQTKRTPIGGISDAENRGIDASAIMKTRPLTSDDMNRLYGNMSESELYGDIHNMPPSALVNGQIVRTDQSADGSPFAPNIVQPTAGQSGIDTGNINIEEILSKYLGAASQPTTNAGIALPTGKGWLSAVLGLSTIINNRRAAERAETQWWHRGVDMTKLISDITDKNRRYGLDARRLGMEEQEYGYKQPRYEAETRESGARAGLLNVQAKNQLSIQDQKEMDRHKFAISEAQKAVIAKSGNSLDERSDDDVYDQTYNRIMNSFNKSKEAKQETTKPSITLETFAQANPNIPKEKMQAAFEYYKKQKGL